MSAREEAEKLWGAKAWRSIVRALLDGVQGVFWLLVFIYPDVKSVSGTCAVLALGLAMYLIYLKGFEHAQTVGKKIVPLHEMLEAVAAIIVFVVVMTAEDPTWISWPIIWFMINDLYHPLSWVIESLGASNLKLELMGRDGWIEAVTQQIEEEEKG